MKVIFQTVQGDIQELYVNNDVTIDELLKKYLKSIGRPDLIGDKNNTICFIFNAIKLKFGDKTTVEKFFKYVNIPKVIVNDVNNLIGGNEK